MLHSYMMLFLATSPAAADPSHDFEEITARALNTYVLGQHVALKFQLAGNPAVNPGITIHPQIQSKYGSEKDPELALALRAHPMLLKSVGLYKVMGEGVQAIVGGTYHQFVSTSNFLSIHTYFFLFHQGAPVAHRLFHQRILRLSLFVAHWAFMKPIMRMLSAEQRWFVKVPREVLSEVRVKVDKRLCWWVDLEKHLSRIIDLIYL